jgi:diguanylate cyclase (GGDEF)-like protein
LNLWRKSTLKPLLLPGAVLLLAGVVLLQGGFLPISGPAINFCYYAVFAAGILLACRFHSSRVLLVLVSLLLAHRAIEFFALGRAVSKGPGHIVFEAIAFLLPVNFIVFSFVRERSLAVYTVTSRFALLFFESVFVAIICRPGETASPALLRTAFFDPNLFHWTKIPQPALFAFAVSFGVLLLRFLMSHKPVDGGLLWSLAATALGLQAGGVGRVASGYFATAGLILVASIIEHSYVLAYHDELTGLPGRRAFNEALLRLEVPYSVAVVDIDHFKNFNDTYGHETGDQVLRMVAGTLATVTGGGRAFRVGGEEFSILFPGKLLKEAAPHLEALRTAVAESRFRIRDTPERRHATRGPDRRTVRKKNSARDLISYAKRVERISPSRETSVTVSIGAAEPNARSREIEQVIQAADKALYRAKRAGRNRVEIATPRAARTARLKRGIA